MDADLLLIGGGVASARCARALRRNGFGGSLLLVGDEPLPPYNRPPLSKELMRGDAPDELLAAEPAAWYERHGVKVLTGTAVTRLDPDRGRASLGDGGQVTFERCLLATGAAPRSLPVPGGESAMLLRTVADARRIRAAADDAPDGAPVVVVGGGLIGVEVASGLAALGLRPTIVEVRGSLWGGAMGGLLADWALARLREAGVSVLLESAVGNVDGAAARVDGRVLPAAFVVAGIGVRPRDQLAAEAGIATSAGILTGRDQRSSHPAVWAAGDVARVDGRVTEHWHAARESGERAALSMLALPVPTPPAPWVFTEVAGIPVDAFGDGQPGDEEEWIVESRLIARTRTHRLVQLVVIGGAAAAGDMRRLVEAGESLAAVRDEVETLIV